MKIKTRSHSRFCFVAIIICLLGTSSCAAYKPIKVGFSGGLTGRNAALGVDGRDGALLAVEVINARGGVNGRPLQLIVQDDLSTREGALEADKKLMELGVVAIIGHMLSETMVSIWPDVKESGMIYLSPMVSTPLLQGQKDNFFRVNPVNSYQSKSLARYAYVSLGLKRIAIIYDINNQAYTETYEEDFAEMFEAYGGEVVVEEGFATLENPDFEPFLKKVKSRNVDGFLVVASSVDTASFAQQAYLRGFDEQILASNWAFTEDLIQNGGRAVDGILTITSHIEDNQTPVYQEFKTKFEEHFGRSPTFSAGYGYESIMVLAEALKKSNGHAEGLAEALLETEYYQGVHGSITLDQFGDVRRTMYIIIVQEGKFKTLESLDVIPVQ
ncbi:MAG: ABC transporter substrate-binding protein [Anaerolineales bacterium]|nr:ABC transporter substrate-binding protein [Anaerolineales bacterium]